LIRFDTDAASIVFSRIDLTQAGFAPINAPVIIARPDLTLLPVQPTAGKPIWTVPLGNPGQLLFAVEAGDGMHVAWPDTEADSAMKQAVETGLKVMQDFYDTRTLLGCFDDADAGDVYSLVMMKRLGPMVGMGPDTVPWSLVILRWKYDPDQKKATLLNRALLKIGRTEANSPPLAVFKEAALLGDVSGGK